MKYIMKCLQHKQEGIGTIKRNEEFEEGEATCI